MQSGTNLPRVRDYNQGVILETIRIENGISRAELAERTGLTKQTISVIVKSLLEQELVKEAGPMVSTGGKRAVKLQIASDARYAVGVQIDIEQLSFVVMGFDGRVIYKTVIPTPADLLPEKVVGEVACFTKEVIRQTGVDPRKILGLGVGCPGPLNHFKGIVYDPPNLPGWHEVPLKQLLGKKVGYPVIIDNDATAAAIGERWSGGAQGARNFAFIYMGRGIGGGLFINNQVYRGSTTNAGEVGHITVEPEGPLCFCGNRGCVELLASPLAVEDAVKQRLAGSEPSSLAEVFKLNPVEVDYPAICQAALSGDNLALSEVQLAGQRLGYAVVALVDLLDVELVVLGGRGFRVAGPLYREIIQQTVNERIIAGNLRRVPVELSAAGEFAGAVGAASLILHEIYSPRLAYLSPGSREEMAFNVQSVNYPLLSF